MDVFVLCLLQWIRDSGKSPVICHWSIFGLPMNSTVCYLKTLIEMASIVMQLYQSPVFTRNQNIFRPMIAKQNQFDEFMACSLNWRFRRSIHRFPLAHSLHPGEQEFHLFPGKIDVIIRKDTRKTLGNTCGLYGKCHIFVPELYYKTGCCTRLSTAPCF